MDRKIELQNLQKEEAIAWKKYLDSDFNLDFRNEWENAIDALIAFKTKHKVEIHVQNNF